jgi:WD40 repeat protein
MATSLRLLVFGFVLLGSFSVVVAQDNPFEANVQDPGKDKGGWGGTSIPIKSGDAVTFGPRGCPVALVGNKVHDVATGKELCSLELPWMIGRISAVSGNGKYVAIGASNSRGPEDKIHVFDVQTGAKVMEIPQLQSPTNFVTISLNRYLISNTTDSTSLDVWDLETKAKKKPIVLGDKQELLHDRRRWSGST